MAEQGSTGRVQVERGLARLAWLVEVYPGRVKSGAMRQGNTRPARLDMLRRDEARQVEA